MTIRKRLQTALDTTGVKTFWKRRAKIGGDADPDEYIVYTLGGDYGRAFADDLPLVCEATATVRYYCLSDQYETEAGRADAEDRVKSILGALHAAGFDTPSGAFDVGDIDDSGYDAVVIECAFRRVV